MIAHALINSVPDVPLSATYSELVDFANPDRCARGAAISLFNQLAAECSGSGALLDQGCRHRKHSAREIRLFAQQRSTRLVGRIHGARAKTFHTHDFPGEVKSCIVYLDRNNPAL